MLRTNTLELSNNKTQFQTALQRDCVLTLIECLDVVDCNEFIDDKSSLMIAIEYQHSDRVRHSICIEKLDLSRCIKHPMGFFMSRNSIAQQSNSTLITHVTHMTL